MKDDTTAKPMIPASSRVSADLNRVPESCYPTLKRTVTKTPPSPVPALPSKPVTTSPRLVTVSRAVDMANLAEFQEGCRKYVQGLKASKAEDEA